MKRFCFILLLLLALLAIGVEVGYSIPHSQPATMATRGQVVSYMENAISAHQMDIDAGLQSTQTAAWNTECIQRYENALKIIQMGQ